MLSSFQTKCPMVAVSGSSKHPFPVLELFKCLFIRCLEDLVTCTRGYLIMCGYI